MQKLSDVLVISYLFPPSDFVSGITVSKRILDNKEVVDVLQAKCNNNLNSEFNEYVDKYINERILIDIDCNFDWWNCISRFVKLGLEAIDKDYKKIYSRSWLMSNHFLACEYKFRNPSCIWEAEFSDPLMYDLSNNEKKYKQMSIDDNEYIKLVNSYISKFNESTDANFPLIESNVSAYFVCEYLVYLFADKIIFTNQNQCEVMLNQFPVDIKELVLSKCEIKQHSTLDDKFYHINNVDIDLDANDINFAYFGNDYYSKRHFESLFYAIESLNHKFKDKIKVHFYLSDDKLLKKLIPSDNFIINKPLNYLDFLNATTKFDVLIVNDVITKDNFEINPYLPSKLSDYLGSKSDIWALYETGSSLSNFDLKYKSNINDYESCRCELIRILDDYGFSDENYGVNEDYINQRLTFFNELYEKEFNQKRKLKRQVKKLKKQTNDDKSSNTWKIKDSLRKFRK